MVDSDFVYAPSDDYPFGIEYWDVSGKKQPERWFTNPRFRVAFTSRNRKQWSQFRDMSYFVSKVSRSPFYRA